LDALAAAEGMRFFIPDSDGDGRRHNQASDGRFNLHRLFCITCMTRFQARGCTYALTVSSLTLQFNAPIAYDRERGSTEEGKRADLVSFDEEFDVTLPSQAARFSLDDSSNTAA
jgi:hypothetical protein